MTHPSRHKRRQRWRSLYLWHRYLGLAAALLALVLAVTGILLNHAGELRLSRLAVHNAWLQDWYGIRPPASGQVFTTRDHRLAFLPPYLWLDGRQLPGEYDAVYGVVQTRDFVVVATGDSLLMLNRAGELLDRLDPDSGLPAPPLGVGLSTRGQVVLRTAQGLFAADAQLLGWQAHDGAARWSQGRMADPLALTELQRRWRALALDWQRVLLDLHSGRIAGQAGVWVMDAAAVILVFLSLSGGIIWLRMILRKRRRKKTRH